MPLWFTRGRAKKLGSPRPDLVRRCAGDREPGQGTAESGWQYGAMGARQGSVAARPTSCSWVKPLVADQLPEPHRISPRTAPEVVRAVGEGAR